MTCVIDEKNIILGSGNEQDTMCLYMSDEVERLANTLNTSVPPAEGSYASLWEVHLFFFSLLPDVCPAA